MKPKKSSKIKEECSRCDKVTYSKVPSMFCYQCLEDIRKSDMDYLKTELKIFIDDLLKRIY